MSDTYQGGWVLWGGEWWRLPDFHPGMPGGSTRDPRGFQPLPTNFRTFVSGDRAKAIAAKGYMGDQMFAPFQGELIAVTTTSFRSETLELIWWDL